MKTLPLSLTKGKQVRAPVDFIGH